MYINMINVYTYMIYIYKMQNNHYFSTDNFIYKLIINNNINYYFSVFAIQTFCKNFIFKMVIC